MVGMEEGVLVVEEMVVEGEGAAATGEAVTAVQMAGSAR